MREHILSPALRFAQHRRGQDTLTRSGRHASSLAYLVGDLQHQVGVLLKSALRKRRHSRGGYVNQAVLPSWETGRLTPPRSGRLMGHEPGEVNFRAFMKLSSSSVSSNRSSTSFSYTVPPLRLLRETLEYTDDVLLLRRNILVFCYQNNFTFELSQSILKSR